MSRNKPPASSYRFSVGTEVLCWMGEDGWNKGTIIGLNYRDESWPEGDFMPYQVDVGRGRLIFVPEDVPQLCKMHTPPLWVQAVCTEDLVNLRAAASSDCDQRDDFGGTALLACMDRGWQEGALCLLDRRADPDSSAGPEKMSPLHLAIMPLAFVDFQDTDSDGVTFSRADCVISARLEKKDAPLDTIEDLCISSVSYDEHEGKLSWVGDPEDGATWSILPTSLRTWVPGRIATLLQGTAVETDGLPKAASRMPVVKALLQARADVNAQNEDPDNDLDNFTSLTYSGMEQRQHRTPLHYAAEAGEAGLCGQLIAGRANVNLADRFKKSPLDLGLEGGSKLVVDILLRQAADPNRGNMSRGLQQTCLHQEADLGHTDLVKLILQHGGKVNLVGKQGMSPLHLAARRKHVEVVEVLLNSGADTRLLDKSGRTPSHYAKANGDAELCAALADNLQLGDRMLILADARNKKKCPQSQQEATQAMINGYC